MGSGGGATVVDTGDFGSVQQLALAWDNWLELSYARMSLGLDALVNAVCFPIMSGYRGAGAKLRPGGDPIYGSARKLSLGLQWRRSRDPICGHTGLGRESTGRRCSSQRQQTLGGWHRRSPHAGQPDSTVRPPPISSVWLSFSDRRSTTLEGGVAVFIASDWLLGVEYRGKTDRLASRPRGRLVNVFVTWICPPKWHGLAYADRRFDRRHFRTAWYYFSVQVSP